MALAVGNSIDYAIVEKEDEYLIVARDRAEENELSLERAQFKKGSDLNGLLYEPLYRIGKTKTHNGKKHQVIEGGFVTTEDGTGIVHIAPMYGEDDFTIGKVENLPTIQLLESNGVYNTDAPEFLQGEYYKKGGNHMKTISKTPKPQYYAVEITTIRTVNSDCYD